MDSSYPIVESNASSSSTREYDYLPEVYVHFGDNMTLREVASEYWNRRHGTRFIPMELTVALCLCGAILNSVNILVFSRKSMLNSMSVLLIGFETANIIIFSSYFVQSIDCFATDGYIFSFAWVFFLRVYPFLRLFGATSSSWFAASIGVWRCLAVASTLKANKWLTKSRSNKLFVGIFLLSGLFSIQALLVANFHREIWKGSGTEECETIHYLIPSKSYYNNHLVIVTIMFLVSCATPAIILVVATIYLIYSLYRASGLRKKLSKRFSSRRVGEHDHSYNRERSVSTMMLTVMVLFLLNWLPYGIGAGVLFAYKDKYQSGEISWSPMQVIRYLLMDDTFPLLNNACTFFVYYYMSENFRAKLRCFIKREKELVSTISQVSIQSRTV